MKKIPIFLFIAGIAAWCASCTSNDQQPVVESNASQNTIRVASRMGASIPLAVATIQPIQIPVMLSGRIDFDPNAVTNVYPLVTGVINTLYVNQGDVVHKGQILADVYSSDIGTAVSDLQKARANEEVADKALDRMKYLLRSKLVAPSDLEQAENTAAQAKAEYDRSLHALKILGGDEQTASSVFHMTAPISGTILARPAQPGSQVRNDGSTLAFTIGSTSSLWVTLDAYPSDLKYVHLGDSVVLKAAGLEDRPFSSRIEYISPMVDPTSFTTKVRCTLPNSGGLLKPAMFVGATVYHPDGTGLFVPAGATFYDADGKTYVFIQSTPHTFRKQEVTTGQIEPDRVQVVAELNAGDTIVADNSLFLNDELQADQK